MREFLSNIEPEEYDAKVYPQLVMGHMVGQKEIFSDDILLMPNPEKYIPQEEQPQTINELAGEINYWRSEILPPEERTPQAEFKRGIEEVKELREAISTMGENPMKRKEAALEATDVMIRMMGVIGALGFDPQSLLTEKRREMYHKYNIAENRRLRQNGMAPMEAMKVQKARFNGHGK